MALIAVGACVGDDPASTGPTGADTGAVDTNAAADSNLTDTGSSGDSAMGPACDRSKAFGAPIPVTSINTAADEYLPWLTPDRLAVYFTRKDPDGRTHLWTATRSTPDGDFGTARRLDELVTAGSERAASLTADGLFIYFAADGVDSGANTQLYAATRGDASAAFGMPVRLAFSSVRLNDRPNVLPDNTALYSSVRGEVDGGGFDGIFRIYRSALPAGPRRLLGTPPHIPGHEAIGAVVTPDETMLVFSAIPAGGAQVIPGYKGLWDILTSRRADTTEEWGAPVIEATLNTPLNDFGHWLSPDGCELWLDQDSATGSDILVARRPL